MTPKSFLVGAALAAFVSGAGHAEALSSYGMRTCDQWDAWHRGQPTSDTLASDNWIFGQLEAVAAFSEADSRIHGFTPVAVLRGLDGPAVIALVKEYCRPQRLLKDAVAELGAQLIAESGVVASGARVLATGPSRTVRTVALRETTGSAVVETTGSVTVAVMPGRCETLVVNGRTPEGVAVTRMLNKCN